MKKIASMMGICALLILEGCANAHKISKVEVGMTREQVVKVMGKPVSVSAQGGQEYLNYKLSETPDDDLLGLLTPYYVRLINGKVESFGRTGDFDSTKVPTMRLETSEQIRTETAPDLYTELQKLKSLKDQGVITAEEFEAQKKKLLAK